MLVNNWWYGWCVYYLWLCISSVLEKVCFQWSAQSVAVATLTPTRSTVTGITNAQESSRDFRVSIAGHDPPEAVLARSPLSDKDESAAGLRCPDCNRMYAFRSTLLRHYRYECGVEPRFQCHICQARFKRNERLTHHLQNVHSVEMNKQRKRSVNQETSQWSADRRPRHFFSRAFSLSLFFFSFSLFLTTCVCFDSLWICRMCNRCVVYSLCFVRTRLISS